MTLFSSGHTPRGLDLAKAIGLGVLIFALLAGEWVLHLQQRELEAQAQLDALAYASALRARIDRELNVVLYQSSGLASYLAVRNGQVDEGELQAILADLYRNSRHVRNFGVAVGTRLTYIHPLRGNERAVGLNYRDIPAQWPEVERAIRSATGTLTGPFELVQGGSGMVYRMPVQVQGRYWGLLSTVIDTRSLFSSAVPADAAHDFALRGSDGRGAAGAVFWGDPQLFEQADTVKLTADIPNGTWEYAVRVRKPIASGYLFAIRLMGWSLAALLGYAAYATLRHHYALAQLALFDPLTRLPNRRHFEERMLQSLERRRKTDGGCSALLFIDLDRFKSINDVYGHKAGDVVLKVVAERVRNEMRAGDTIGRWGGDELVALVNDTDAAALSALQVRLHAVIEMPIEWDGVELQVGVSIGSATYPLDGASARELFKVADERMYDEKQRHYCRLPNA
jgi:diguanylate cyclase